MKRIVFLTFLLFAFVGYNLNAQGFEVTGKVTSSEDGSALPGVSVVVQGTTIGAVTNFDGNYTITVPENAEKLMFSFVGMSTEEVDINGQTEINVSLSPDMFGLDEVIVTGVASMTPRKKLSITVDQVGEDQIKEVPGTSAAGALQGKVSGLKIVSATGRPGDAASIRLRGATTLGGSQAPLIIVDGVMIEGTLADINVDDIETMEVVKGAAASALYGSRAGNGVISITTKRGRNLAAGTTIVTARYEYGQSNLAHVMPVSTHHVNKLADDWADETRYTKYDGITTYGDLPSHTNPDSLGYVMAGGLTLDDDHYMDNEYGLVQDHLNNFYRPGNFQTSYVSVATNTGKTNFMTSFEDSKQQGVVFAADGYHRSSFRVNVDHQFSEKFSFSTSNLIVKSTSDQGEMDFFSLMQLQPDMDLYRNNPVDGSPYRIDVDQFGTTENPLYYMANTSNMGTRNRVLSNYQLRYNPFSWMVVEGSYSLERQNNGTDYFREKGFLSIAGSGAAPTGGLMWKSAYAESAQTFQATINLNKQFGDFVTKAKLSYLYEQDEWEYFRTDGRNFAVAQVPDFSNMDQSLSTNQSNNGAIKAENWFGIVDMDYKSKYIGSFLYRIDGASQFGEEERYNPYYRVSGAYRITEDVTIPGVNELKIRAAHGTAGHRPPWDAQYETFNVGGGSISMNELGNSYLKPTTIKETEFALNSEFLNMFSFELIYAITNAEDQHWRVPLPASYGYGFQWQNMATLHSESWEATLGAELVNTQAFKWNANLTFDRNRMEVSELNVAPFTTGSRGNDGDPGAFFITEGSVFGTFTGQVFLRSLEDMQAQLDLLGGEGQMYEGVSIDEYMLNSDGYVIPVGTEGTYLEAPVKKMKEDGTPAAEVIGDANADFNIALANTFKIKDFTIYALLDWKQGGDIYNLTNQWMYRDNRAYDMDQFGKPDNQKKTVDYYKALYNVASYNNHFVEDGTYLKLRELAVYYSVNKNVLGRVLGGFVDQVKIGFVGRNLLTITSYSGFDPEVGSTESDPGTTGDATIQAWDEFTYPNFRTYSGTIEIKF